MTKINPVALRAQAARALRQLEAAKADLEWVRDHAQPIADRANAELDDGTRGRAYDGDGRGGQELTSPEAHVDRRLLHTEDGAWIRDSNGRPVFRDDPTAEQVTRFLGSVALAADASSAARTLGGSITTSRDLADRAQQASNARPIGGRGKCENCGRFATGERSDRLVTPETSDTNREGRIAQCPACLVYWKRNTELRPPRLWLDTPPTSDTTPPVDTTPTSW